MPLRAIFSKYAAAAAPSSAFTSPRPPDTITTASRSPNFWATAVSSSSVRGRSSSTRTKPIVEGPLEQSGDGGRRHPQGLRDVLLAAPLAVVELQTLHHEPEFAGGRRGSSSGSPWAVVGLGVVGILASPTRAVMPRRARSRAGCARSGWAFPGAGFDLREAGCYGQPTVRSTVFRTQHGQAPPDHVRLSDERVRLRARRRACSREQRYELTDDEAAADLILVNTCAIREKAEDKVFSKLGELRALKAEQPELDHRRHGLHGAAAAPGRDPRARRTSTSCSARRPSPGSASWSSGRAASGGPCSRPARRRW